MTMARWMTLPIAMMALATLGCQAGNGTGVNPGPGPGPGGVSLAADVQPIFDANCTFSGCHSGNGPAQGMDLTAGQAFANTVGVPSVETMSRLFRVEAGNADSSYLVIKIEGNAAQVGGTFTTQMPLGLPALSPQDMQTIRTWIDDGAQDN